MSPTILRALPLAVALLALCGCGSRPITPRVTYPASGEMQLDPPARVSGLSVHRIELSHDMAPPDPHTGRTRQSLWVELRVEERRVLRAEDFSLARETLAEFAVSAGDDLTPRLAAGLADRPGDALHGLREVEAGARIWLAFPGIELRALNADGGHAVPLRITLLHEDGSRWLLADPAVGLPVWRPERDGFGVRTAVGIMSFVGPADGPSDEAYGGDRGGDGVGVTYQVGAHYAWQSVFVALDGGLRAGSRSVFADGSTLDPRVHAFSALELHGGPSVGWRWVLPTLSGSATALRLSLGWHAAAVFDKTTAPTGGLDSLATVHALPIDLSITIADARDLIPVAGVTGRQALGVFFRLTPRLGVLAGDARYGDGLTFATGLEVTVF